MTGVPSLDVNVHPEQLIKTSLSTIELGDVHWSEDWLEELDPTVEAELLRQFEDMEFDECTLEEDEVIL